MNLDVDNFQIIKSLSVSVDFEKFLGLRHGLLKLQPRDVCQLNGLKIKWTVTSLMNGELKYNTLNYQFNSSINILYHIMIFSLSFSLTVYIYIQCWHSIDIETRVLGDGQFLDYAIVKSRIDLKLNVAKNAL